MKARSFAALAATAILLLAAALAGSAQDIDNCCFVDRQCHNDQDWADGYYAFQNNQCAAPGQTGASAQPAGGVPAQIDNCCFVDRQCHNDQDWTAGYYAFQNNQCQAPAQSVRSVDQADIKRRALRIEGSARYLAAVNAALDLFKARAPHWYVYTVFGHDWSLELPEGTIVSPPPHVKLHLYTLAGSHLLDDICWFASHLVHYAAHNYQDERNMASGGSRVKLLSLEDEREALTVQIEALEATCPGHGTLPWWREILANIDNPEYQWWHG